MSPESACPSNRNDFISHLASTLVWIVVAAAILFIPMKIIGLGYLPMDDAMRHAAKAVSGKSWSDILVTRPGIIVDPQAGWSSILGLVHRAAGRGTDGLVAFSVVSLFAVFCLCCAWRFKRPESWVLSLVLVMAFYTAILTRLMSGRPCILAMAAAMTILLLWSREDRDRFGLLLITTVLIALSVWIDGNWCLWVLVPMALALTGAWGRSALLGLCWLAGSVIGASLTGHPIAALAQQIEYSLYAFGDVAVQRALAVEFRPTDGVYPMVLLVATVLLARTAVAGRWEGRTVRNPAFVLTILGWVMGLRVGRFWWDWGLPAGMVWIAQQIDEVSEGRCAGAKNRLCIAMAACLTLALGATGDSKGRWTNNLTAPFLASESSQMAEWLPGRGGIIYSADADVFYQAFFRNPNADWKYVLGFAPVLMTAEDFDIYRRIQSSSGGVRGYKPWIAKLQRGDRIVIEQENSPEPVLPELEWRKATDKMWIGRLRAGRAQGS